VFYLAENFKTSEAFLEEVAEQISYRPLRPAIVSELQDHIEERIGEYQNEGYSREQAEQKAVAAMGDPVVIGTEINAVRHVRSNPVLVVLTAVLMLAGLAAAVYINWTPEQYVNGFGYYLPGLAVLLAASFYSYPLLVKYWKRMLLLILVLFIAGILSSLYHQSNMLNSYLFDRGYDLPRYLLNYFSWRGAYYAALILGSLLTVAIYSYRHHSRRLFFFFAVAEFWILLSATTGEQLSAIAVFVISFVGTILFMFSKKLFNGKFCLLFPLLLVVTFLSLPYQKERFQEFTAQQDTIYSVWDDAYNGVLIRELLSKTPITSELSLTPTEMINYGTGNWYFGTDVKRLYPDENTVTLWDILPQHYHNNYLLAVGIFMFGWLFGFLCLAVIGAFFLTIFRCVFLIRGKLASCMAFNCAMVLLVQTMLYIAGNLGYQYEYFTNLPLVSEGKISIVINMLLLGFIFSAYRYDKMIEEPASFRVI